MLKCEKCIHKKICIDGANYKNAEACSNFVNENDVFEVIRCKDCYYYDSQNDYCNMFDFDPPSDEFYCRDSEEDD